MKAIALFNEQNGIKGYVSFEQQSSKTPLKIVFDLKGFQPHSTHAIHIHEYGDLSEGCKSLGAHFNPTNTVHFHSEQGHAGDLFNNFITDRYGNFYYEYCTSKLALMGKLSVLGRSVVIHQFPDDYGLEGIISNSQVFTPYVQMTNRELEDLCNKLGYKDIHMNRMSMLNKLLTESNTTGNASTRIAGAIIGLCKI